MAQKNPDFGAVEREGKARAVQKARIDLIYVGLRQRRAVDRVDDLAAAGQSGAQLFDLLPALDGPAQMQNEGFGLGPGVLHARKNSGGSAGRRAWSTQSLLAIAAAAVIRRAPFGFDKAPPFAKTRHVSKLARKTASRRRDHLQG